jgi:hypothetical protein
MQMERLTKTLSMEKSLVRAIEKIAKAEGRSFTRQAQILLELALKRHEAPRKGENAQIDPQAGAKGERR